MVMEGSGGLLPVVVASKADVSSVAINGGVLASRPAAQPPTRNTSPREGAEYEVSCDQAELCAVERGAQSHVTSSTQSGPDAREGDFVNTIPRYSGGQDSSRLVPYPTLSLWVWSDRCADHMYREVQGLAIIFFDLQDAALAGHRLSCNIDARSTLQNNTEQYRTGQDSALQRSVATHCPYSYHTLEEYQTRPPLWTMGIAAIMVSSSDLLRCTCTNLADTAASEAYQEEVGIRDVMQTRAPYLGKAQSCEGEQAFCRRGYPRCTVCRSLGNGSIAMMQGLHRQTSVVLTSLAWGPRLAQFRAGAALEVGRAPTRVEPFRISRHRSARLGLARKTSADQGRSGPNLALPFLVRASASSDESRRRTVQTGATRTERTNLMIEFASACSEPLQQRHFSHRCSVPRTIATFRELYSIDLKRAIPPEYSVGDGPRDKAFGADTPPRLARVGRQGSSLATEDFCWVMRTVGSFRASEGDSELPTVCELRAVQCQAGRSSICASVNQHAISCLVEVLALAEPAPRGPFTSIAYSEVERLRFPHRRYCGAWILDSPVRVRPCVLYHADSTSALPVLVGPWRIQSSARWPIEFYSLPKEIPETVMDIRRVQGAAPAHARRSLLTRSEVEFPWAAKPTRCDTGPDGRAERATVPSPFHPNLEFEPPRPPKLCPRLQ
ncbi:hypothetical protein JHW43_006170 [Diplocarpon mali]|nr:hypothetical protein JHW43_006170 [Diplocarpon mali]